jgi:hypothetical protein
MNVASLELCKELYELSGWQGTNVSWYEQNGKYRLKQYSTKTYEGVPAYDLSYLLRKLPNTVMFADDEVDGWLTLSTADNPKFWAAFYQNVDGEARQEFIGNGETPEDATASLAIALFESGVLKND